MERMQIVDAVLIANELVDEKRRLGEERVVFKLIAILFYNFL